MNLEQFLLFMTTPVCGLLIGFGVLYLTRHDRRHPHPGE